MKALVEKDILIKNKKKRCRRLHIFLCTFIKGTQGNSRELKRTQGNPGLFMGSARRSNRRKKTQEKGQRGKISQLTEQEDK